MLNINNISFHYKRGSEIFHDVSFHVGNGETCSIIGPNGAGKSTLLKCINQINRPTAGAILKPCPLKPAATSSPSTSVREITGFQSGVTS